MVTESNQVDVAVGTEANAATRADNRPVGTAVKESSVLTSGAYALVVNSIGVTVSSRGAIVDGRWSFRELAYPISFRDYRLANLCAVSSESATTSQISP